MKVLASIYIAQGVKASIALFVASIVSKGISYLTTPFYTRMLTAEEYGSSSIFMTWQNVFGIIAMFSLMNGVFNNGMVDYPDKRNQYSTSMLVLSNLITIVFAFCLALMYPFVGDYIQLDAKYLILMFAVFIFQPAYSFWSGRQRYELKWKALMKISILMAIASPVIAILSIKYINIPHLDSRIFGAEIPLILFYLPFYFYILKASDFRIDTSFWKSAFLFNLPLIPHYLSSLLLGSSDTLMISYLVGLKEAAYYSVSYSISTIVAVIWAAVNASLIPFTYEKCKVHDYQSISKYTIPILGLFAMICLIAILFAPEILKIMATKEYLQAIYCIPSVVIGVFFQVQYYIYANVVFYYKKPVLVMIASVIATTLNIILNYIFIPRFGYLAAGYTSLICYICQAIIDFFAMKYVVGAPIYNMKQVLGMSVAIILMGFVCLYLYDSFILRYTLIVFILPVCVYLALRYYKKHLKIQ